MRSSAPWRGCPFESLTTPRSVATESAYRCGETNHDTATIRNIRARVVMAQKYRFSDFCKTDRGRGTGVPAEGLEPTRSCDHWILSPARLPFRHAGVSKGSERIRTSQRSSNASYQIERLQTARRSKDFAQNDRVPQTGRRSQHCRNVGSPRARLRRNWLKGRSHLGL